MNISRIIICLLALFLFGCNSGNSDTDKFQSDRNNVINVKDQITDIKMDDIFGKSFLYIIDDFLVIVEVSPSKSKGIHLYNKNTFEYVASAAILGHGPGEIVSPGKIGIDNKNRTLWVPDHGKKLMMKFPLDSILRNEMYKPKDGLDLNKETFLVRFGFLNDSIAIGKAVHPTSNSSFEMITAKLNVKSNETRKFGYEHPKAVGKNSNSEFKISLENQIYVNCYGFNDLMTICDLEGNLKYNVYGPDGLENKDNRKTYFRDVDFIGDKIIASYIGDTGIIMNEFKRNTGNLPSKILIFDKDGNYEKTIETGHKFTFFCVDNANKRVIAYFDDRENPLGYFNLD